MEIQNQIIKFLESKYDKGATTETLAEEFKMTNRQIGSIMEKPATITYRQLRKFVNAIPDIFIDNTAMILISDETIARALNEPCFVENDIYSNKSDYEDSGTLKELKEKHGDDFNEEDYIKVTTKGSPFLWSD